MKLSLEQAQADLDAALRNSFDTAAAMQILMRLVKEANIAMVDASTADLKTFEEVARWVTKIVGIFGLDPGAEPPYNALGWRSTTANAIVDPKEAVKPYAAVFAQVKTEVEALSISESTLQTLLAQQAPDSEFAELEKSGEKDIEALALPYARSVSRLRDELRRYISAGSPDASLKQAILTLSDRIRDYDLTDLGVQLDDQVDKPSLIKFVPAARLIAAREEKFSLAAEKAKQKELGKSICRPTSPQSTLVRSEHS